MTAIAPPVPDHRIVAPDNIFDELDDAIQDFVFNTKVASVFDDMVDRSVPYYRETRCILATTSDGTSLCWLPSLSWESSTAPLVG